MNLEDALSHWRRDECINVALDIETTIECGSPDPWSGARTHIIGVYDGSTFVAFKEIPECAKYLRELSNAKGKPIRLIGHNFKFDNQHINFVDFDGDSPLCGVWDTMIAEYLLSGQTSKFPSLEYTAAVHGIAFKKDDEISDAFKNGIGADKVDQRKLKEYLRDDLIATYFIFLRQKEVIERVNKRLANHVWVQSLASCAYGIIEANGLHFNRTKLDDLDLALENQIDRLNGVLKSYIKGCFPTMPDDMATPTPRILSACFYDTPSIHKKDRVVVGKYKNGKPKLKTIDVQVKHSVPVVPIEKVYGASSHAALNDNLGYSVADNYLETIENLGMGTHSHAAGLMRRMRGVAKMRGTYTGPIKDRLDSCRDRSIPLVHGNIHACSTGTGRTSSSGPNLQNMPEEIRKLVTSRFNEGVIIQADFKQVELWGAAVLSGDAEMLRVLRNEDFHFATGKETMGWTDPDEVSKDERRKIKALNFGLIYGGGDKKLSDQSGVPIALVKRHRENFYRKFPRFAEWQKEVALKVDSTLPYDSVVNGSDGFLRSVIKYITESGRFLSHTQKLYERPWGGFEVKFSWSEVVNYPVQSFATGDVVPLFIVWLMFFRNRSWMFQQTAVAVVHDSLVLDTPGLFREELVDDMKDTCVNLGSMLQYVYEMHIPSSPELEIEFGETWT